MLQSLFAHFPHKEIGLLAITGKDQAIELALFKRTDLDAEIGIIFSIICSLTISNPVPKKGRLENGS